MPYPYYPYQPYAPQMPQMPQVQTQQQSLTSFDWVQGEEAAKSYRVAPNTSVLLMDSEGSRFYIKAADASGMPLPLRTFSFQEVKGTAKATNPDYVTRDEMEKRLAELMGGLRNERTSEHSDA